MKRTDLATLLNELKACADAVAWAETRTGTYYDAWRACERGDWLLWIAAKVGAERKLIVRAACGCARLALEHVPSGEERPRIAIETAEAWCDGRATLDDVRSAALAAAPASASAAYASAASAAYNAANAAYDDALAASNAAAYDALAAWFAANAAAYAANAYSNAAYAAAAAAARAQCATIVRRHIPWSTVRDALEGRGL